MIEAEINDRERVIDILVHSFENNQSVNYILKQDKVRLLRIRRLMEYAFNVCTAFGKVIISEDRNGCALVVFPDQKRFSFASFLWDLKLVFGVIGIWNVFRILKRQVQIKEHHPPVNFYYLWFIGVHPVHKGLGIGSGLMNEVLEDAIQMGRPVYLETSTFKNISWYKKFGFQVFDELNFNYTLFFLRR